MFDLQPISDFFYKRKDVLKNFDFLRASYIRIYLIFLLIINSLEWLFARFIYFEVDGERMALHYNVDFGIDFYGEKEKIFNIPKIGLLIIVVNMLLFILAAKIKRRKFIGHVLFSQAIICNIILLLSLGLIYLVNFY